MKNKQITSGSLSRPCLKMFDIGFFSGDGPVMVLLKCRIWTLLFDLLASSGVHLLSTENEELAVTENLTGYW